MPPCNIKALAESAQSNLAQSSSLVMSGLTVIVGMMHSPSFEVWPKLTRARTVLFFVGAGTVFRLAYYQSAATPSPEGEDRALLARPHVHPASRIAFPVAGVNSGRIRACPTAARPKAPALSPLALVTDEDFQRGKDSDNVVRGEPVNSI